MKDAYLLFFFFFRFKSTEEAERKQVNLLIDLIPSKLAETYVSISGDAARDNSKERRGK